MSLFNAHSVSIPFLITGPQVRRAEPHQVCISILTSSDAALSIELPDISVDYSSSETQFRLGEHLYLRHLLISSQAGLPLDTLIAYRLVSDVEIDHNLYSYGSAQLPAFLIPNILTRVLHGSCRNPHHHSEDALAMADIDQQVQRDNQSQGAQLLILSGDQIYADDVAGPMLLYIQQLIEVLGIYREQQLDISLPPTIEQQLYNRDRFLPYTPWQQRDKTDLGYWLRRDLEHFTSLKSENHLVFFEEFIALYLLTYSANAWQMLDLTVTAPSCLSNKQLATFDSQQRTLTEFANGLGQCERLMANICTIMMFDDHDVTDDWNLTAAWEQAVYDDPVSNRIICNGLISYWLFQGFGNDSGTQTGELSAQFLASLSNDEGSICWDFNQFDQQIKQFDLWSYQLNCQPKVVVIDTRTQRWRNEQNFNEPSGLMDWQQLSALEDSLEGEDEVILVSPAPVFGVKSIEAIQAIFNVCGQPLLVDVENWMAHEGAARKLMHIFRRVDTPCETLILSGDVHYSFCFSVQARFSNRDNRIWQLTASGIKNEFPKSLLGCLDKLDSFFYGRYSPLNFFTKRWQMKVEKHATLADHPRHLVSQSGISIIELADQKLARYVILHGNGEITEFDLENH